MPLLCLLLDPGWQADQPVGGGLSNKGPSCIDMMVQFGKPDPSLLEKQNDAAAVASILEL